MLQIHVVREDREKIIQGLKKRRLKDAEVLIDKAIALDQKRRETQRHNDDLLSQANNLAKEIGALMKAGEKEKAEEIKVKTSLLKKTSGDLTAELSTVEAELQQLLYFSLETQGFAIGVRGGGLGHA